MKNTMKALPKQERPYERCMCYGADALSDAELLSVLLRSGAEGLSAIELAYDLLKKLEEQKGLVSLHQISIEELCSIRGIGKVKAIQLKCIAELSKRIAMASKGEGQYLRCASDVAEYLMEQMRHLDHEEVFLLSFNSKSRLLSQKKISIGTINQSSLSPREIFLEAMNQKAAYVIVAHNHPSGDPTPSSDDNYLTQRLMQAGGLIGIELMDHIIIGDHEYYSYKEQMMNE